MSERTAREAELAALLVLQSQGAEGNLNPSKPKETKNYFRFKVKGDDYYLLVSKKPNAFKGKRAEAKRIIAEALAEMPVPIVPVRDFQQLLAKLEYLDYASCSDYSIFTVGEEDDPENPTVEFDHDLRTLAVSFMQY